MPMYANKEWDHMYDELNMFLESHNLSELLHIASDAALHWECRKDRESKLPNAIPIEWIKEWYKTHVLYLKEEKPVIYAYEMMIMNWEEENE